MGKYKLADMFQANAAKEVDTGEEMKDMTGGDEDDEEDEEVMTEVNGADLVANAEPQFRDWFG